MPKTVIITGGNRGIGKAISELFLEKNYKVIIIFKNKNKFQETQEYFKNKNYNPNLLIFDISNLDWIFVNKAKSEFFRIIPFGEL